MASGRSTKLTGAIGEFLVSAELCRRGLIATPFAGNVPHYDIVASDENGRHLAVQVKTINKLTWQFTASAFIKILMDGDRQVLGDPVEEPYPNLFCVLVVLGDGRAADRYFVLSWKQLAGKIISNHSSFLAKHNGVRPRAPKSTHCALRITDLAEFEDRWDLIETAMTG